MEIIILSAIKKHKGAYLIILSSILLFFFIRYMVISIANAKIEIESTTTLIRVVK